MSMLDLVANKHFGQAANGDRKSMALVLKVLTPSETNHDNHVDDLLLEFREKNARIIEANGEPAKKSDDPDKSED
jgi:hypothetical protein